MQVRRSVFRHPAIAAVLAVVAALQIAHAADAIPPWPTAGWQTSTPEAQGMSSSALADLVDFGAASAMDSMLVERHGRVVLEAYYAPFRPELKHLVNSVTKAVVGTLAGIASKEGRIGRLDAPVLGLFPERTVAHVDARKSAMTLENLLDSNSGLSWQEPLTDQPPETMLQMERSADWVGFVLDREMAQVPGTTFNYDSGTWHLLSAIVARQTGQDTLDYAKQKLFAPLGIADVAWRRDPQGIPIGGYGLYLLPRDMAKIGYLYLHGGRWGDQQLLPPAWVDKVFHPQVDMRLGTYRYANGWWAIPDKHAYMAVGYLRQLIVVLPEIDTVAVVTGRGNYPFAQLIDRVVSAALSAGALPADATGSARLADRLGNARIEKASPIVPASALASVVSGKTYRLDANLMGMRSMRLDLTPGNARYEVSIGTERAQTPARRFEGPMGLDGLFRLREAQGTEPLLAVKGGWLDDKRFQVVTRSLLEGIVTTYVMTFNGQHLDVSLTDNRGVRVQLTGDSAE